MPQSEPRMHLGLCIQGQNGGGPARYERHGTNFTREDFLRFESVTAQVMGDEMIEMVPNDPDDVVYRMFSERWFQEIVRMFQRDNEMRNIVITDREA